MYGELLANSSGVRGDSRVTPGGHGVTEGEIAVSHPHLQVEVEVKGMSERWLCFLKLDAGCCGQYSLQGTFMAAH